MIRTALLCLILLLPSPAFAWGPVGHTIVARIASRHLTPEAQREVDQLLKSREMWKASVSSWADNIRKKEPATYNWHFVDVPSSAAAYDPERDCKDDDCVVGAIKRLSAVLADRTAPELERVRALKFLIHFVGDVHQPLHALGDDRGGNDVLVWYRADAPPNGRPPNLHFIWDVMLIQWELKRGDALEYADAIDEEHQHAPAEDATGPVAWTNESHKLAQEIYEQIPKERPVVLPRHYGATHRKLVRLQLERGGLRLAEVLNQTLRTPNKAE